MQMAIHFRYGKLPPGDCGKCRRRETVGVVILGTHQGEARMRGVVKGG